MSRRWAPFVLGSVLVHGLLALDLSPRAPGDTPRTLDARAGLEPLAGSAMASARRARLEAERASVLARGRAELAEGQLELGRFLLDLNRIEAALRGLDFDAATASARYAERVAALRAERAAKKALPEAAAVVFADLSYQGMPGGLAGAVLLEGGGSCEQLAQLLAAAAYDAGYRRGVTLRFYGGVMADGVAHITIVAPSQTGAATDLLIGRGPYPGGVSLQPEELVEIHARALEPGAAADSGRGDTPRAATAGGAALAPARPTLAAGLPPSRDRFPGTLPLFASRAVPELGSGPPPEAVDPLEIARGCAYFLRLGVLSPQEIPTATASPRPLSLEPRRTPNRARLEREAELLSAATTVLARPELGAADRLMARSCVVALGETAAVDLALVGNRELSREAATRAHDAYEQGSRELASVRASSLDAELLRRSLTQDLGGRGWLLLFLRGGDEVVLELAEARGGEDWGRISATAALLLWPTTRERALDLVGTLPLADQVDVMHEIFHAHDHFRPWSAGFDFGDLPPATSAGGASFLRVYGVFRGLAWRLWEARAGIPEVLGALEREASAAGIDEPARAALLEYLGRNALGLYSGRSGALDVVRALDEAAARRSEPSLASFRLRLDYLRRAERVDATSLADAWRVP